MKTTDTWKLAQNVQGLAYVLLKRAVTALGGEVIFSEDEERPMIPANLDHGPGPCDYLISRLVVNEAGLFVYGYEVGDYPSTDEEVEILASEIFTGWIQFIFDYLPEVEGFDAFATTEELLEIIKI